MYNTTVNNQTNNKLMKDVERSYKLMSCIYRGFNELYNLTTNYLREQCSDGNVYLMLQDGLYNENGKSGEKLYTKDNFNKIESYCDICAFVEFTGRKIYNSIIEDIVEEFPEMYPALNFDIEYTLEDMYDDMVKLSSSDRITWRDSFDRIKDYQDYYNKILSNGLYNAQFIVVNFGNKSTFEYDADEVLRFYSSNQCCAIYLYNTLLYFNSMSTPKFITNVLGRVNMASYDRYDRFSI